MNKRCICLVFIVMLLTVLSVSAAVRKVRVTCSSCNGTGKDKYSTIDAPDYSGKSTKVWCDICGRSTNRHTHKTCVICHGRGWVEKSEYYQDDSSRSSNNGAKTSNAALLKFEWYYNYEPEPGRRLWYQTDALSWVEQYPSGYKNYLKYVQDCTLDGVKGVLVQKSK